MSDSGLAPRAADAITLFGMTRTLLPLTVVLATLLTPMAAQTPAGDWPLHNLDAQSSRFLPLDQINTSNADQLTVKWQIDLPKPASAGTSTPIVVGGIMYVNSAGTLFAIDGATGTTLWTRTASQEFPGGGRGPASGDGRVYIAGRSMIAAFDLETGRPSVAFGTDGVLNPARLALDFKEGLAQVKAEAEEERVGNVYRTKWGFIDRTGHYVAKPQFESAKAYSDGMAAVEVKERRFENSEDGAPRHLR